ncbi:hypothetical protein LINPERPRIM_LOCUS11900 [Linum perenne]
MNLAKKF